MTIDYAHINQLLFEGKKNDVAELTQAAIDAGEAPNVVLREGLIAGMKVVGEDFKYNRIFVPEVLLAARAMKAGMAVLQALLTGAPPTQSLTCSRSASSLKASTTVFM